MILMFFFEWIKKRGSYRDIFMGICAADHNYISNLSCVKDTDAGKEQNSN